MCFPFFQSFLFISWFSSPNVEASEEVADFAAFKEESSPAWAGRSLFRINLLLHSRRAHAPKAAQTVQLDFKCFAPRQTQKDEYQQYSETLY